MVCKRLSFSLRSLIILVLLIASGIGLWWRWEPWVESPKLPLGFSPCSIAIGKDLIVLADRTGGIWISDFQDRELSKFADTDLSGAELTVSPDTGYVAASRFRLIIWETASQNQVCNLPMGEPTGWLMFSNDGAYLRLAREDYFECYLVSDLIACKPQGLTRPPEPLTYYANLFTDPPFIVSMDNQFKLWMNERRDFIVATRNNEEVYKIGGWVDRIAFSRTDHSFVILDHEALRFFRFQRPPYWWGLAWLPEFWLAVVFSMALGWILWRDRRHGGPKPVSQP